MKVAVIGGGAAGLMAAATIRETHPEAEIFLLEKNDSLGKKVIISGGGRCNVTTGIQDVRTVLTKYPRGGKFLSSAMYAFPPERVYAWFEAHGIPLKIEADQRVFPVSNDGKDVVRAFEKVYRHPNVHILLNMQVDDIKRGANGFEINSRGNDEPLVVDKLILTTGGQAYRHTGSTGDGYAFATSLGHTITPLAPSLSSFTTKETWVAQVSGLSFANARLSAGKFNHIGAFLFTHKGISGPAVFALSSLVAFESFDATHPLEIAIDLFPEMEAEDIRQQIVAKIAERPKKQFSNILQTIIPASLVEVMVSGSIIGQQRGNETSKIEITRAISWLKGIPLHATSRGTGDEFVTGGGVDLAEVDPKTLESKICPGLFFAGEILDIDGFTGGFNLQASWATGHLAGENIS